MRNRGYVGNTGNLETSVIERPYSGFASRTGALDVDIKVLDAVLLDHLTDAICGNLGSKRGTLARPTETGPTGCCPSQRITLAVTDGDDGVVEGSMDVRNTIGYAFLNLLLGTATRFCHLLYLRIESNVSDLTLDRTTRALTGACVGTRTLSTQGETTAMTNATVATEIHQALDVH